MVQKLYKQAQIGDLIRDNSHFLRSLSRTKSTSKRRSVLKGATAAQLLSIVEVCVNILCSRFRLTTRQRKRMLPYAHFIRQVARKRTEHGARKFLVQKGSGLPGVFAALLTPILIEVAKSAIDRIKSATTPSE